MLHESVFKEAIKFCYIDAEQSLPNKLGGLNLSRSRHFKNWRLDSLKNDISTVSIPLSLESDMVSIDSLDLDNFKNWQLDSLESLDSLKNDITTI